MQIRRMAFGAVLALASLAIGSSVQAGMLNGSQSVGTLGSVTFTPGTDIQFATSFSINGLSTGGSLTGDYLTLSAPVGTALSVGALNFTPTSLGSFVLNGLGWGTFNGASLVADDFNGSTRTRSFFLSGAFSPAAWAGSLNDANQPASLTIAFTQSTNGGAVSVSGTLNTPPAAPPGRGVPEPTTYVAALMGVGTLVGMVRRNRKSA